MITTIRIYSYFILLFLTTGSVMAQVSIGTGAESEKAAILDVKSFSSSTTNVITDDKNKTSNSGGLILPRVKLKNKTNLEPFLATSQLTKGEKLKHTGLLVYNIYESPKTETDVNKMFRVGIYSWDGSKWCYMNKKELDFFHIPSFNIDITENGTFSLDLYAEYVKQFGRIAAPTGYPAMVKNPSAPSRLMIFNRDELDFYVTFYDTSIMKDIKIDNKGVMKYTIDPKPPFSSTPYMNVVFVVK